MNTGTTGNRLSGIHHMAVDVGYGVPLSLAGAQAFRGSQIELCVHQIIDHVCREPGMDRIIPRRILLEECRPNS